MLRSKSLVMFGDFHSFLPEGQTRLSSSQPAPFFSMLSQPNCWCQQMTMMPSFSQKRLQLRLANDAMALHAEPNLGPFGPAAGPFKSTASQPVQPVHRLRKVWFGAGAGCIWGDFTRKKWGFNQAKFAFSWIKNWSASLCGGEFMVDIYIYIENIS